MLFTKGDSLSHRLQPTNARAHAHTRARTHTRTCSKHLFAPEMRAQLGVQRDSRLRIAVKERPRRQVMTHSLLELWTSNPQLPSFFPLDRASHSFSLFSFTFTRRDSILFPIRIPIFVANGNVLTRAACVSKACAFLFFFCSIPPHPVGRTIWMRRN